MTYRSDIDGLRAIAVLSVVAYHLGVPYFTGGFTGVDIFFVISGYVIFSSVADAIEKGAFDSRTFLKRRLYRIQPALFAVLMLSSLVGYHVLGPKELSDFALSAIAATFSVSNIYFDDVAGNYFAANAESFPLLHTWSLGVEEQFYLLVPLLFVYGSRRQATKVLIKPLLIIIFISFAANLYDVFISGSQNHAFYLPSHRFWEIGCGACLALLTRNNAALVNFGHRFSSQLSVAGFAGIILSILLISNGSSFPGIQALVPCLSATLLILAFDRSTMIARLLSSKPLTFIGRLSFSIYLVHWPVIVFYKLATGSSDLSYREIIFLIGLTFILAVVIWFWLENPMRRLGKIKDVPLSWLFTIPFILLTSVFIWINQQEGFPNRLSPAAMQIYSYEEKTNDLCNPIESWKQKKANICGNITEADQLIDVFIWGDSHADMIKSKLLEKLSKDKLNVVFGTMPDCPPLLDIYTSKRKNKDECLALGQEIKSRLSAGKIKLVVLASRWANLEAPVNSPGDGLPSKTLYSWDSGAQISLSIALEHTISELTEQGANVLLIGPIPEINFDVPKTLIRAIRNKFELPETDIETFTIRQSDVLAGLKVLENRSAVSVVYPHEQLCTLKNCMVESNNKPLYADDDHLNSFGVEFIIGPIVERIKQNVQDRNDLPAGG